MVYEANTPDDLRVMLRAIGKKSLDDLFKMIPAEMRAKGPLAIPPALSELELTSSVASTLSLNQGTDQKVCFLGGGATIISSRQPSITLPAAASSTPPTLPIRPKQARALCRRRSNIRL